MDMKPVKSSNLEAVGYDEKERRLKVQFKKGGTWVYEDVPAGVHESLMRAESVGRYFAGNISGKYRGARA